MVKFERFMGKARNNHPWATCGKPLNSLQASDLRDHFYRWRGASNRRYVFSIFPRSEEATVAEFSEAVIIGVVNDASARQPICILSSRDFETEEGRLLRAEARSLGVNEWHVHFDVDSMCLRDLASVLLN